LYADLMSFEGIDLSIPSYQRGVLELV